MKIPNLKSKEAKFLGEILKDIEVPAFNPIFSTFIGQMGKMLTILDNDASYQRFIRKMLNRIKEEWKDD
ncbi:MAG: hypothetical protein ABIH76_01545 [Candidatus Bathyarchaeota archaeon]